MKYTKYFLLLPSIIGIGCLFVLPYLDVFFRSFLDGSGKRFVGIQNYKMILKNESFCLASINTVKFLTVCIPILVVLSLLISVFMQKNHMIEEVTRKIFLLPYAMPVVSMIILCKVVFAQNGFLSQFLYVFHVESREWYRTEFSFWILVCNYIWKNLGYNIVLWLAVLTSMSVDMYEAATMDGANETQKFLYLTIPNISSSFFLITTLSVINGFKIFREAYMISGDYPDNHIYLLQHIFNNWFRELDVNKLSAAAVIVGLVMGVFIFLFRYIFEKGE